MMPISINDANNLVFGQGLTPIIFQKDMINLARITQQVYFAQPYKMGLIN